MNLLALNTDRHHYVKVSLRRLPVRIGIGLVTIVAGCSVLACDVNVPAPPVDDVVSLAGDIQPIFTARCAICHAVGAFAHDSGIDMLLTEGDSYQSTVDQPSSKDSDFTLITPSSSTESLLYLKVSESSPPVGLRMPLLGSPLSSEDLGLIRDWIDQGALDN